MEKDTPTKTAPNIEIYTNESIVQIKRNEIRKCPELQNWMNE